MKKRIFALLLPAFLAAAGVAAQPAGQSAPDARMLSGTSPTGQGLGNLSSPDLFDGSTNISIPIYQYEGPGGNYGISFGYNTKGIKVDQVSSSIGLGFSLQAGGFIQRRVKDLPDELNISGPDTSDVTTGGGTTYYAPSVYVRFKGKYVTYSETPSQAADANTYRDGETDEFYVSAGPLSFSFQLAPDGSFFTIPENRAKIELLLDGLPVTGIDSATAVGLNDYSRILSFRITDVQGNRYFFARGDHERKKLVEEYSVENMLAYYYFATKWDLSRVILSSGAEINFDYTTAVVPSIALYNQSFSREGADLYGTTWGSGTVNTEYGYFSKLLAIRYPNGTRADFLYDPQPRCDYNTGALNQVVISGGDRCMRYMLHQAYFMASNIAYVEPAGERPYGDCYNPAPGSPVNPLSNRMQRLKLKRITISSCDSSVSEPYYSFDYDSTRLPARLDANQDYFGYANAATLSSGFDYSVPAHQEWLTGTPKSGKDKTPNLTYMKAGILTKISNAYGGQVSFRYGSHSLGNVLGAVQLPASDNNFLGMDADDGLRLETITETDRYHPENSRTTDYSYSEGKRFLNGGYFHYPTVINDGSNATTQVMFNGIYVSPHQLINGSNHGYGQVTVTSKAGAQLLSRRVIRFSNFEPGHYSNPAGGKAFYEFPYTDKTYIRSWEIGLPLSTADYDENGHILQESFNDYYYSTEQSAIENTKVGRVQRQGINYPGLPPGIWQKRDITDTYHPVRGRSELYRTVTRKYVSDSRYIADTASFYYDDRHNLSATETQNSRGATIRSKNVYNYAIGSTPGLPVTALNNAGLELLVSSERWTTIGSSNDQLLDASITGYQYQDGKLWAKNLYKPELGSPMAWSLYEPNPSAPYQQINTAFSGGVLNRMRKISEVMAYDGQGNPLESRLMDREQYKAMIWDSATGRKLAEGANCRYQELFCTSFEESWPPFTPQGSRGNFTYQTAGLEGSTGLGGGLVSGRRAYRLRSGSGSTTLATSYTIPPGKPYHLSFWVKNNVLPVVTLAGNAVLFNSSHVVHTANGWFNYQIDITNTSGAPGSLLMAAAGADIYIDEVRLAPVTASVQSYTYTPLCGMSSATDPSGRITYYEYDLLGRRTIVRDQDGYILSKTEQVVQGQD